MIEKRTYMKNIYVEKEELDEVYQLCSRRNDYFKFYMTRTVIPNSNNILVPQTCFFQVGRLLLRKVVGENTDIPYSEIKLKRTERGKPYLVSSKPR